MTLIVILVVAALLALYIAGIYNALITARNGYTNAFAQIEVQLKRRYDLIPNLVETVKGYMKHERETLESVIALRNLASDSLAAAKSNPANSGAIAALGKAEQNLTAAMGKLSVVVEAYPDLKANQNMIALSEEIASTENKVSFARQAYNDAITHYNNTRESFPNNLFAGAFGHPQNAALLIFEDSAAIQAAPKVSF
ncbi:hypothetical protein FACS189487_03340 [Campylobacterota bacterium]|nr:hypothetical protein FACS189487_03340 [Campylobacterota bacterium]GHV06259.1 hypothetical protein AGMMS50229_10720 [Campylobacterota bacterium]